MRRAHAAALLTLLAAAPARPASPTPPVGAARPAPGWLDVERPAPWSSAGAAVPRPPAVEVDAALRARCRDAARSPDPSSPADQAVTAAGWTLLGPLQRVGSSELVQGSAGVDGMCRPRGHQGFLFVGGAFAGTLAPSPVDARADGAALELRLVADGAVQARYARYAPQDPLCCPSRTATVAFRVERTAAGPRLVPGPISTEAAAPPRAASPPTAGPPSESPPPGGLLGRTWQLSRILLADGTELDAGQPGRYTLRLDPGGRAEIRADCNRAGGGYTLDENALGFGPMATTLAACPPDSLSDVFLQQLGGVRSFVIDAGRLHLAVEGGGQLELR